MLSVINVTAVKMKCGGLGGLDFHIDPEFSVERERTMFRKASV